MSRRRRSTAAALSQTVHLSAVVLEELYAGATDARARKVISKLESEFANVGRLLVPNLSDWSLTGQVLAEIGKKYGYQIIKRSRMTNDCLIALSARRAGLVVITHNAKDFRIISEFRRFGFEEV